jgi:hypothetical protein
MYTPLELLIPDIVTEALEWGLKCSSRRAVDPLALEAFLRDLDLDPIEVLSSRKRRSVREINYDNGRGIRRLNFS